MLENIIPLTHTDNWTDRRLSNYESENVEIGVEGLERPPGKGLTNDHPGMYPFVRGERDMVIRNDSGVEYRPPMLWHFFTKKKCKPGNHRVAFHLTYGSEAETHQYEAEATFRVRNWQERHWRVVVGAGIIAVIVAVGSLFLQTISFFQTAAG